MPDYPISTTDDKIATPGDLAVARRALDEAASLPEVASLIDRADVMRIVARKVQLSLDAQNDWASFKLDAERRAGDMLEDIIVRGRPKTKSSRDEIISSRDDFQSPRLAELGISLNQSHKWQKIASIPAETYEHYKTVTREQGKEITETGALRIAKELERAAKQAQNAGLVDASIGLRDAMEGEVFSTIVVDPPWDFGDEGDVEQFGRGRPTYAAMPIADIAELPIVDVAAENAHLYLWITNRSLPKGFALLDAWGFRYVTMLTWCKPSIGMGNYFRGSTEHVLFGVRGSLPLLRRDVGTWFAAPRSNRHSAKPDAFYELIETCSPGPWLDVFARTERSGWMTWGAEV